MASNLEDVFADDESDVTVLGGDGPAVQLTYERCFSGSTDYRHAISGIFHH